MIGNDIIDLNLAKIESDWKRKGFLEKQFTDSEINHILNSEKPFITVWRFWSMKEAAYKCYTQKNKKRFFAPKKFECFFTSNQKGMVTFMKKKFYSKSFLNRNYIYTIVEDEYVFDNHDEIFLSSIVKPKIVDKYLKDQLEKETGVPSIEIEKRKSDFGVPFFYYNEKQITKSCTISHHGNYCAFAFILDK